MKRRLAVKGGLHPSGRKRPEKPPAAGVIRPETGTLRLPSDLRDDPQDSLLPHRVVLVIALLWLLFTAIMTWFVVHMPAKSGELERALSQATIFDTTGTKACGWFVLHVDPSLTREAPIRMKVSKSTLLTAVVGLALTGQLALALASAKGAGQKPQDGRDGATQIGVFEVKVPVSVKHGSKYVDRLTPQNFEVYEDGKRQKIEKLLTYDRVPLKVAILMDTSNSVKLKLPFEKDAAEEFVAKVASHRRKDQVLFATFDSDVELVQDFTEAQEPLIGSIRKVRASGHTKLYDGVYRVIEEKLSAADTSSARRIMVILSDGEDTASERSLKDAIDIAQRQDVTVFGISTKNFSGVGAGVVESSDDKELRRLCKETGGELFLPSQRFALYEALRKVAESLENGYLLFYAPENQQKTGKNRSIEIKVKGVRGQTSHRQGYVY